MMVIMLAQSPPLALACFAIFPVVAFASFIFRVVSTDVYRETRERIGLVTAYLQETISGVSVVRAYGREERHVEEFTDLSAANRDANMRSVYLNAAYFPAIEFLQAVRSNPTTKKAAFIILTAQGDRALVQKAAALGANNVLAKPFTIEKMKAAIEAVFGALK